MGVTYEEFVRRDGARLRAGLVAACGPEVGAEALAYGFEQWDRLAEMANAAGDLYRVGQSQARRHFRPDRFLPARPSPGLPDFEPALVPALEALSEPQRVGVVLVHALGGTQREAAELLDVDVSIRRTRIARAMAKLRTALEVTVDAR